MSVRNLHHIYIYVFKETIHQQKENKKKKKIKHLNPNYNQIKQSTSLDRLIAEEEARGSRIRQNTPFLTRGV